MVDGSKSGRLSPEEDDDDLTVPEQTKTTRSSPVIANTLSVLTERVATADGDANGDGPISTVRIRTGLAAPLGLYWDTLPPPALALNDSLARPVSQAYIEASRKLEGDFGAVRERGWVPTVVNNTLASFEGGPRLMDLRFPFRYSSTLTSTVSERDAMFSSIRNQTYQIDSLDQLEFIKSTPPIHVWQKAPAALERKWELLDRRNVTSGGRSAVRVACLYAGFVRDFGRMFLSCTDKYRQRKCLQKHIRKLFGAQRDNILDTSNADVYVSTWDIVGAGRYDTHSYNLRSRVSPKLIKDIYSHRLAGLHMQNYSAYDVVWRYMARIGRVFPQSRPTRSTRVRFWSVPEANYFFRVNDYSQSYKNWCVTQLALLSGVQYDVFFRLRMDLRAIGGVSHFTFAETLSKPAQQAVAFTVKSFVDDDQESIVGKEDTGDGTAVTRTHFITNNRVHVQNFDYADFGFLGTPRVILHLASVWLFCLMPESSLLPARYLGAGMKAGSFVISEYNQVLWRLIFDNRWEIDNGHMYLRISRRMGVRK